MSYKRKGALLAILTTLTKQSHLFIPIILHCNSSIPCDFPASETLNLWPGLGTQPGTFSPMLRSGSATIPSSWLGSQLLSGMNFAKTGYQQACQNVKISDRSENSDTGAKLVRSSICSFPGLWGAVLSAVPPLW